MSTTAMLTEEQWARIELLLPPLKGAMGRPALFAAAASGRGVHLPAQGRVSVAAVAS
jgi:hypothetical protein